MKRRQTGIPHAWLIVDARTPDWRAALRRLPVASGVLVLHHHLPKGERQRLIRTIRRIARSRGLLVVDEAGGDAIRVHDPREIARASLAGARLILLSPLYPTGSHPDWKPLPRMRAAALARLAGAPVLALGGMDGARFKHVRPLGFEGWAAIDGWSKVRS